MRDAPTLPTPKLIRHIGASMVNILKKDFPKIAKPENDVLKIERALTILLETERSEMFVHKRSGEQFVNEQGTSTS